MVQGDQGNGHLGEASRQLRDRLQIPRSGERGMQPWPWGGRPTRGAGRPLDDTGRGGLQVGGVGGVEAGRGEGDPWDGEGDSKTR